MMNLTEWEKAPLANRARNRKRDKKNTEIYFTI